MKGAETREMILDAAVEIGSRRGLEDLSVGGLAATVQMSKSGLFAHFGSKEELQLATVAQAWQVFEAHVLVDPLGETVRDLGALLERWLSFYEWRIFTGGCFFVVAAVEFEGRPGAVRDALASAVEDQLAALEAAIGDAVQSKDLDPSRDPRQMAFELHSSLVTADALFHVRGDAAVFQTARAMISDRMAAWRLPEKASGRAARSRRRRFDMGSRQRPSGQTTSDTGGSQARAGTSDAGEREVAAEQRRHEEEMLSDARKDAGDPLSDDSPAPPTPGER